MAITPAKCPVCGEQAYRNASGQLLAHTTTARGSGRTYVRAEKCPGSTPGARP